MSEEETGKPEECEYCGEITDDLQIWHDSYGPDGKWLCSDCRATANMEE